MRLAAIVCAVIAPAIAISACSDRDGTEVATPGAKHQAEVSRVIDGDTVEVEINGREEDVRYIGVDTPESVAPDRPVECFGPESSSLNRRLVEGREVTLIVGQEPRDQYGRLLAYVRLGDVLINAELVRRGFATTLTIPPNDRLAGWLHSLETRARNLGIGLWGLC